VLSKLRKTHLCYFTLLGLLVTDGTSHSKFIDAEVGDILHNRCSSVVAHALFLAPSVFLITLLNVAACIVLLAYAYFTTILSILAVKDIRTVHCNSGGVDIFNHILFYLRVVIKHGHRMRHVLGIVLLLLAVGVNFSLYLINLSLNVIETPLLGFLHLNHHLFDLFELLEAVGGHLLELLLFGDKHVKARLITLPKECMFNNFSSILGSLLGVIHLQA